MDNQDIELDEFGLPVNEKKYFIPIPSSPRKTRNIPLNDSDSDEYEWCNDRKRMIKKKVSFLTTGNHTPN